MVTVMMLMMIMMTLENIKFKLSYAGGSQARSRWSETGEKLGKDKSENDKRKR